MIENDHEIKLRMQFWDALIAFRKLEFVNNIHVSRDQSILNYSD